MFITWLFRIFINKQYVRTMPILKISSNFTKLNLIKKSNSVTSDFKKNCMCSINSERNVVLPSPVLCEWSLEHIYPHLISNITIMGNNIKGRGHFSLTSPVISFSLKLHIYVRRFNLIQYTINYKNSPRQHGQLRGILGNCSWAGFERPG